MVVDPSLVLFPLVGAAMASVLAWAAWKRRAALGGAAPDWVSAFLLCAGAFGAAVGATVVSWNNGGDLAAGFGAAGGSLGLAAAMSGLLQRYSRGSLGAPRFRLALFVAGLALVALGLGAAIGSVGLAGDFNPSLAGALPAAAGFAVLLPITGLAARKTISRARMKDAVQLVAGTLFMGAGLLIVALGELLMGPWVALVGGAFIHNGLVGVFGKAPAPRTPTVTPKVEEPVLPTRGGSGRKVRVPKGGAMKVTSFRDDGPSEER